LLKTRHASTILPLIAGGAEKKKASRRSFKAEPALLGRNLAVRTHRTVARERAAL